jgi:hypothetical protein
LRCVNIGCGCNPTEGWNNYENSLSLRLAGIPILTFILKRFGLMNEQQWRAMLFYKESSIKYADARKRIPEADHSVDVLYSSHMLEHLYVNEAQSFLAEAKRVLKHNGYIRLAVPCLRLIVNNYLESRDADRFIIATGLSHKPTATFLSRIRFLLVGERGHKYMYDGASLCKLLVSAGFKDAKIVPPGETMIPEYGDLDLAEQSESTVYVEAVNL